MLSPTDAEWDEFVAAHPDATFFHRAPWRRLVATAFGHKSHDLFVRDEQGRLAGVLPLVEVRSRLFGHALISTAFCVGGGPLARDAASREALLRQASELGRRLGVDYVELRDTADGADGWVPRSDLYFGFERPIEPEEEANLLQIPRKQRAVLRKALARDLPVTIDRTTEHFFPLYAKTMRDHGTPALPRRYFDLLLEAFGDDCEILTVHHEGQAVSSVLSYYFRDRVMPYYTGSRAEARGTGANDVMYWSVMRRAVERGYGVFDFGRSKVGTGPYAFKRNWGFEPRPITHQFHLVRSSELPNVNPTNPKYQLLIGAWRRLPVPVANTISPFLSRSLA